MGPFLEKGKISLTQPLILQPGETYSGQTFVLLEKFFCTYIVNDFKMRPGRRRQLERNAKTDKTSNRCTNRLTTGLN